MSKPFDDGAYAHQRLNLRTKGKAHGRNAKASNRTCEMRLSGIIGGPRETQPWWNCEPASHTERARTVTLHLPGRRARALSQPRGNREQRIDRTYGYGAIPRPYQVPELADGRDCPDHAGEWRCDRGSRRLAKQSGLWLTGRHDRSFSLYSEASENPVGCAPAIAPVASIARVLAIKLRRFMPPSKSVGYRGFARPGLYTPFTEEPSVTATGGSPRLLVCRIRRVR